MILDRHCDLCDLPFEQCAHGLARRERRAATKAKKKAKQSDEATKARKAAKPQHLVSGKRREQLPEVLRGVPVVRAQPSTAKGKRKCVKCQRSRYGRYNVCARCLRAEGGRQCVRCGRLFRPSAQAKDAKKCGSCSGRNVRAWVVTTMGAPGLGKRA